MDVYVYASKGTTKKMEVTSGLKWTRYFNVVPVWGMQMQITCFCPQISGVQSHEFRVRKRDHPVQDHPLLGGFLHWLGPSSSRMFLGSMIARSYW